METKTFRTNLNCGSCLAKVTPFLNAEKSIEKWSLDTSQAHKPLTVSGSAVSAELVKKAVEASGFKVFEELSAAQATFVPEQDSWLKTYYPLVLIFGYLSGVVLLLAWNSGVWESPSLMANFMGGFFLVFSFFKLLNLQGFATAYATYDLVAKKIPVYGFVYPFLELFLGLAYLLRIAPFAVNIFTLILMAVSSLGVLQALLKKSSIQCACLGTVFKLPMTKVTLFEDLLMVAMAGAMLL